MDNTARMIDLALAETLISQKKTYSSSEYQQYKYELLNCILGKSVIGNDENENFNYFTRSNRARNKIAELGQDGLIIELIKNAIKFDAYVTDKTWCKLQTTKNLNLNSDKFNATNVVPFIVDKVKCGEIIELMDAMKKNENLCEAAITSFVETRYERGLFNKGLDEIYLKRDESCKLINNLEKNKIEFEQGQKRKNI